MYGEGYDHVEDNASHKHRKETKHGGDWFEVQVVLVIELS